VQVGEIKDISELVEKLMEVKEYAVSTRLTLSHTSDHIPTILNLLNEIISQNCLNTNKIQKIFDFNNW